MLNALRRQQLSIVWMLLRVWLGWQWLEAGLHKISDPNWMQTGLALKGFWAKAVGALPGTASAIKYSWYEAFIRWLLNGGHYVWFAKLIAVGEILTGTALILGAFTIFALLVSAFMNLNFMLAGTASTNPVLYTVAIILLLVGPATYYYGVDRLTLPYLKLGRSRKRAEALAR